MKKSSIVIALSLLAMSTLATADGLLIATPAPVQERDYSSVTGLPKRTLTHYKNFKEKKISFNYSDCRQAVKYATSKINGTLLNNDNVGYKLDNNIETRIFCDGYDLIYQTAEQLPIEEVNANANVARKKEQREKEQREKEINSRVDVLLLYVNY